MTRSAGQSHPTQASAAARQPFDIRLESPNYVLRPLEERDVCPRVCGWLADPAKAVTINAPARAVSAAEFKSYIASHDRISGHLLGIFEKASDSQVGLWSIYIDWDAREFLLNVLVGERIDGDIGARLETQRVLTDYFFETLDLETLRCAVLARNTRMESLFALIGIAPEHVEHRPSATQEAFEEIHYYRVDRATWRGYRAGRQRRDLVAALQKAAWAGI